MTASCAKGQRVVFGGFKAHWSTGQSEAPVNALARTTKAGQWNATVFNESSSKSHTLTAIAYCAPSVVLTAHTATSTAPQDAPYSATAKCPTGQRVAFGGFSSLDTSDSTYLSGMRLVSAREWKVSAFNFGTGGHLTAIAYCGKVPRATAVSNTVTVPAGTTGHVSAKCPSKKTLAFGGFTAGVTEFHAFVLLNAIVRTSNRELTVSAPNTNGGGHAGPLKAIAYCT